MKGKKGGDKKWRYPASGNIQKGDKVYIEDIGGQGGRWLKARGAIGYEITKEGSYGIWKVGEVRRPISTKAKRK